MENNTKERAVKTMKETIKNLPFVLLSSIPGVGIVVDTVKESYDAVVLQEKLESFNAGLNEAREKMVSKDEEYKLMNINYVELFFDVNFETNDEDNLYKIKDVLEEVNEECTVLGTYGCVYKDYVLLRESLQIEFEETYSREYVDEYIEKIKAGIENGWQTTSPIAKVKYY